MTAREKKAKRPTKRKPAKFRDVVQKLLETPPAGKKKRPS